MATAVAPKGLEGIVATTSSVCWIDGDAGVLSYRGIDIHELAEHSTFEETTYLLWFGPVAMLFVRNENGSHNPDEAMEIDDFLQTVSILTLWLVGETCT